MRRLDHGLAVLRGDEPAAGKTAHLQIGAGKDRDDAGRRNGGGGVDWAQLCMSVGAAQQKDMKLAGPVNVVGVGALPREKAEILLAAHSSADAEIAHEPTLRRYRVW